MDKQGKRLSGKLMEACSLNGHSLNSGGGLTNIVHFPHTEREKIELMQRRRDVAFTLVRQAVSVLEQLEDDDRQLGWLLEDCVDFFSKEYLEGTSETDDESDKEASSDEEVSLEKAAPTSSAKIYTFPLVRSKRAGTKN